MKYKTKKGTLAINTIMLYILTFSNYLFSFMTVPYQTRVLGPEIYGVLGFAFATMVYFQLVMDFGFTLSGTAEIARIKEDKEEICRACEAVIAGKFILFAACAFVLFFLCNLVPQFSANKKVFWICLAYSFMNTLIPDFLYRGMEDMKAITYRTIFIKFIFTMGVFLFVKSPSDYMWVPYLYLLGSFIAVIVAYIDVQKRFALRFVKLNCNDVILRLKESFPFFVSRIASTVYGATNTVLLGLKYSGQNILGFYTSADKIVSLAKTGSSPIADSLYPYMIANKDFKLVKKILSFLMPVIIFGATILFIFAPQICTFVFGAEYKDAAIPLRGLIPVMILVLPNYIMGFPMMTPLGIAKYANLSVIAGAAVQLVLLAFLWVFNIFSILHICIATSITESIVFLIRLILVVKKIRQQKTETLET